MLWSAGQARTLREGRERLAELYVGVRDGYVAGNVGMGKAKSVGARRLPSYLAPVAAPIVRSPAVRDAALAKLGAQFPGIVRRLDS
jgi:hypothetical protein